MRKMSRTMVVLFAIMLLSAFVMASDPATTATVFVPGFNPNGSSKQGVFGTPTRDKAVKKASILLGVPEGTEFPLATNQIVGTDYYGDQAPDYYTEKDLAELKAVGRGTPRYALITAKFIRNLFDTTKIQHVNVCGASFGALISRYMIEHDLEGLASSKKIVSWLTVEGALTGAYPANLTADPDLKKFLIEELGLDIIDPLTMHYDWVEKNINKPRDETSSPFFKDILIAHQISTKDDLAGGLMSYVSEMPNDGLLLVRDMAFRDVAPESRFHDRMPMVVYTDNNHAEARKDDIVVANLVTFIRGTKRVTIRLIQGRAIDFDEDEFFYGPAEIVFQATINSPFVQKNWKFAKPIGLANRERHTSPVVPFRKGSKSKSLETVLFDWMVNPEEKSLELTLKAEEIDWDEMYKIQEDEHNPYEDLGSTTISIPVDGKGSQRYQVKTDKWELELEVEIYDYKGLRSK